MLVKKVVQRGRMTGSNPDTISYELLRLGQIPSPLLVSVPGRIPVATTIAHKVVTEMPTRGLGDSQ